MPQPDIKRMIANYLRYNELTRHALEILRGTDSRDELHGIMEERESLIKKFEESGWQDSDKAAEIIQNTLELEKQCIAVIAARRDALKNELVDLNSKKRAIKSYHGIN